MRVALEAAFRRSVLVLLMASAWLAAAHAQGVTVAHERGELTFDAVPTRVVALEFSFVDALLNMGVTPVGVARDANPLPIIDALTEGVPSVGTRAAPNLEAIVALAPDLIIADLTRHGDLYDQLSAIAPTLLFNSLRGSYEDVLTQYVEIGRVFGRGAQAEADVAAHRAAYAEAAASAADSGKFVAAVDFANGFTAHSNASFVGSLLEMVGRTNALEPNGGETQFSLSLDGLAAIDPEAIVVFRYAHETTSTDEWHESPVWQSLKAVQSGRVYVFDRDNWTSARGLMALDAILTEMTDSGFLTDQPAAPGFGPAW
ncbi:MAG TPA: ABC transporter substrate-binding protein [Trueperaceae bacterium]|nr:ABC transporter substrate-binding protein [Trueperaceae bacterium]